MIALGATTSFECYLKHYERPAHGGVVWRWDDLAASLADSVVGDRGSVALTSSGECPDPCIAPGISAVVQVVPPGGKTTPHAHSFWHIFIVRSGHGDLQTAESGQLQRLSLGDVIAIPAWCDHCFVNAEASEPLILLALQNLPAMAELGSLARRDRSGMTRLVYAEQAR